MGEYRPRVTRRRFLRGSAGLAGGLALTPLLSADPAAATPAAMQAAIKAVVGDAPLSTGRIKIELPPLVENGNAVPLGIAVDSAMSDADHVKSIHIFTEKNPQPHVAVFHLGPRAGSATVATRMRLADTQMVTAIAAMSDGTFWRDDVEVVVTLAACLEES
ncbi:MAG: SoxY-related AACIE arm protein [Hyphomicrobiales bacterium]|nr:SoxY-related AACIE arm protein [Hyphomicrobiales bacterium]